MLESNIEIICVDLGGSGMSEGEYISLGYYEQLDLNRLIEYGINCLDFKHKNIFLYGRSMGAVTALLYLSNTNY